jgi:hypothetical protein
LAAIASPGTAGSVPPELKASRGNIDINHVEPVLREGRGIPTNEDARRRKARGNVTVNHLEAVLGEGMGIPAIQDVRWTTPKGQIPAELRRILLRGLGEPSDEGNLHTEGAAQARVLTRVSGRETLDPGSAGGRNTGVPRDPRREASHEETIGTKGGVSAGATGRETLDLGLAGEKNPSVQKTTRRELGEGHEPIIHPNHSSGAPWVTPRGVDGNNIDTNIFPLVVCNDCCVSEKAIKWLSFVLANLR